eukprot:gene7888-10704_t
MNFGTLEDMTEKSEASHSTFESQFTEKGNGTIVDYHKDIIHSSNSPSLSASIEDSLLSENIIIEDHDDTHSTISDIQSIGIASKTSNKYSNDKKRSSMILLINKLKQENTLLKESFDKIQMTDVSLLKTRLRGSQSDLVRVKQYNMELKDRVQVLEQRLFDSLNENRNKKQDRNSDVDKTFYNSSPLLPELPDSITIFSDVDNFNSENAISETRSKPKKNKLSTSQIWESKCKHLSKLLVSYETRMEQMQIELDELYVAYPSAKKMLKVIDNPMQNRNITMTDQSYSAIENNDSNVTNSDINNSLIAILSTVPATTKQRLLKEIENTIIRSKESDRKIITELSLEIKNLTSLKQSIQQKDIISDLNNKEIGSMPKPNTSLAKEVSTVPPNTRIDQSYSISMLLFSFIFGALIMACSIFIPLLFK